MRKNIAQRIFSIRFKLRLYSLCFMLYEDEIELDD